MHPYALLQKLRGQLPKDAQLKEVQKIPTGFALHPNNTNASLAILQSQNKILEILEGATIEAEEKWVTVIIPNAPTTIQSFEGDNIRVTEEMAKNEIHKLTEKKECIVV